jgi:hypothetical protein
MGVTYVKAYNTTLVELLSFTNELMDDIDDCVNRVCNLITGYC